MSVDILKGLSRDEVETLQKKYGLNRLEKTKKFSAVRLFLSQFKSPLIYVLLVAGLISLSFGHITDALIVLVAVGVNVILGYYQEYKAERSLEALEEVVRVEVDVMRGGKRMSVSMDDLVPGDVVFLKMGDKVPADGVVVRAESMTVNEAVLTGESVPVEKSGHEKNIELTSLDEVGEKSRVYMGTSVVTGLGTFVVVDTGSSTRVGMIALRLADTKREKTVLQKKIGGFARVLTYIIVIVACFIFVIGYLRGEEISQIFLVSVALAVSAIPEGLVVALTAILAVGMQRILRRRGLVRKLLAAEALGSVTIVCSDKTGTLTEGKMKVADTVGDSKLLAEAGILSNDMADPLEIAMAEWGEKKMEKDATTWSRKGTLPFSPTLKYGAVHVTEGRKNRLIVRGAPEVVLSRCRVGKGEARELKSLFEKLSSQGHRLVGVAERRGQISESLRDEVEKGGFAWLGIVVFDDPVRGDLADDVEKLRDAGVDFRVITGDFAGTAGYVMEQLGIEVGGRIILGPEFAGMSKRERVKAVAENVLFARFSPEDKLEVVKILQARGEVVAMMGDGVNDAPALKKADVGIVVSSASEVSKETADMVLLDDDFATVVEGVEEGRGIYSNIRKVVLYLLSDSFSEMILVIGSIIIGIPLPLTAAQILWINLANDSLPALALTLEPLEKGLMKTEPRKPDAPLFDEEMRGLIAIISGFTGLYVLFTFWYMLRLGYSVEYARTLAFLFMGVDSLLYVFVAKSLDKSLWKINIFSNMWLVMGVLFGLVMQVSVLYVPSLQRAFRTHAPNALEWGLVVIGGVVLIATIEGVKWFYIRKKSYN